MLDREALVVQIAKAFVGESVMDPQLPTEDIRRSAEQALNRVELFLGLDVEQAKGIISRVLEEVT
jgi:hypothetical protein